MMKFNPRGDEGYENKGIRRLMQLLLLLWVVQKWTREFRHALRLLLASGNQCSFSFEVKGVGSVAGLLSYFVPNQWKLPRTTSHKKKTRQSHTEPSEQGPAATSSTITSPNSHNNQHQVDELLFHLKCKATQNAALYKHECVSIELYIENST